MALSKLNNDSFDDTAVHGRRNLIINGAQIVSQRNGTTDTTISSTGNVYTLDRWGAFVSQTGKISVQQSTDVPSGYSFKNSAKITSLSAYSIGTGDYFGYNTALEGQDVAHLGFGASGAKSITISFWVKSSLTGTFGIAVREQPSSPGRSFPTNYTISSANTWEHKTLTVPGDTSGTWSTDNTAGFNLWFDLGTGSSFQGTGDQWNSANDATTSGTVSVVGTNAATWYVTGVQVEVGDKATPFEHRSFGDELRSCQRYYEHSYPYGTAAGSANGGVGAMHLHAGASRANIYGFVTTRYTVQKRAAATVTIYSYGGTSGQMSNGDNGGNIGAVDVIQNGATSFLVRNISGGTLSEQPIIFHYRGDAEL